MLYLTNNFRKEKDGIIHYDLLKQMIPKYDMIKHYKSGFTLVEMIFCLSIILVILLLVIPEVTSKNRVIREKSCDAQLEVVNSQIILYEIENGELPTSISQLTSGDHPYLKEKQAVCPSGLAISISDGEAYVSK